MCCQESGEREATVQLHCPNAPSARPNTEGYANEIYCFVLNAFVA